MTTPTNPPNVTVSWVDPDPNALPGVGPRGNVARGNVEAPVLALGATAGTGGTFAAGTYFWVVTAINANGETTRSNEVTATLVATGTQVLTWNDPAGDQTGFRVYRATAAGTYGATTLVAQVGAGVFTLTDTGTATTAGTPSATNTATQAAVTVPGERFTSLTPAQKAAAGLQHFNEGDMVNMSNPPNEPGVTKPANSMIPK